MKLKHFYVSVCMVLVNILSINAQTSVTLTQAGTLSSKLPASEADRAKINELIINGPLNGADILTIRALAGTLKILNLKEANIVEDKVTSYRGTGNNANYTQNDVIGDYMFYGMTALTKVVLPKTVWSIGTWSNDNPWNAEKTEVSNEPKSSGANNDDDTRYPGCSSFARCVNLQEVELPSTLLWIGPKAFSYCIKLTSIAIPEGVEAMGAYTFNKCQELTTASIPSTLGSIKKLTWYYLSNQYNYYNTNSNNFGYTFSGCTKLASVTLSNNIERLAPCMFSNSGIVTIELPSSLLRLNSAFAFCSKLAALNLPEKLTETGSFQQCSSLKSLIIPNGVTNLPEGYSGSYANDGCFQDCANLTSITLPNQLATIPASAFANCTSLSTINIPNKVAEVGNWAFYNCTSLTKATLSTETGTIGNSAFQNCSSLSEINFPSKLILIGSYTFANTALKKVQLPQSLTEIKAYAFQNCKDLESLNFPPNVTDIYSYTFQNCKKLKDITLPSGLMTIQNYAFDGCSSLGKVTIPGGVQTINEGAFQNSGLTEVILSDGVVSLSNNSFNGCNLLKTVTFPPSMKTIGGFSNTGVKNILFAEGAAPEAISEGAFANCDSLLTVTLPNSIKKIGKKAFYSCDTLQSITLPTAIDSILTSTFYGCRSLKSISIPSGVKGIQSAAFARCSSLKTVTLPTTLSYIGDNSFRETGITSISLPEGLKELYYGTFADCDNLVSIKLPNSLSQIINTTQDGFNLEGKYYNSAARGLFYNCSKLESIDMGKAALTALGFCTFYECQKLRSIDLSGCKLEEIPDYAFYDCDSLRSVKFPTTLTTISNYAFAENFSLASLTLPAGFSTIKDNAFNNCKKIKSIDFSATSLTSIKDWFAYTDSLRTVKLPETVTSLEDYAFRNCIIQEINLPAALTSIGRYALNSSRINNLTIPAKVTSIGEEAFSNGTYDQVVIPSNVTSIGNSAFYSANIRNSLEITPSENIQMGNSAFRCKGSYYENGHSNYYHLSNVYWNSSTQFPKDKFGQIDNLYLPADGTISSKDNIGYIFYNGITDSIAIAYSNNRYSVSKAMKTKKVTYARNFNQTSGYGEAAGWQTIVLPFNVKEITYSKRYSQEQETIALAPFGSKALETAGTLPFWLYELGTDGKYKAATEIKAHQAYLICMPNNDKYPSENNINGEVKFAASDAANGITLGTTQGVLKRSKGTKFDLVPTYDGVMQHDTVYVLNENNWYYGDEKNYPAGSVFIKNYNENYSSYPAVYPFRAYLATNEGKVSAASAPMLYSIGGGDGTITGIEDIPFATPEKATKAYSRNGVLYINTNADRTINIYDVTGRTVRIIEAREGMNEVHGLDSGIYLLEGQKVVIGR